MSREQREELMALSQQAFGSPALMDQLAQLDANLQSLRPGEDWSGSERFDGEQGLGLGDGTGVLQDLADLDELADQLSQSYEGARMDDLDLDKLSRQLGNEAAVDARTLQRLEQALRDSGYLKRTSDGQLSCHPRRCASSARRCCGTWPRGCPADRASATSARPAPRGSAPGPPAPGSSATPSPGTSPRTITNAVQRVVADGGDAAAAAYASTSTTSR